LTYFIWKPDGIGQYDSNDQKPALSIMVSLEDGTLLSIKDLPVTYQYSWSNDLPNWQQQWGYCPNEGEGARLDG
jgi:hypothetical protein